MNRHEKHAESASKHTTAEFTMPFGVDMADLMYQPAFAAIADANGRLYAFKVYSDFYRQAFEDYQGEFAKLTKMGQGLAAEAVEAMQTPHKGFK